MRYHEFRVSDPADFIGVFGVAPEPGPERDAVEILKVDTRNGDAVTLSFDRLLGSVAVTWNRHGERVWSLYREGATLIRPRSEGEVTLISMTFETTGLSGTLDLQIEPTVSITDKLLHS